MAGNETKTFKMRYEDPGENYTFSHESMVYFSMCTEKKVLSLHELFKLTSDVAVEAFNEKGLDRDFLTANHYAILVSRATFRVHRMPRENERIITRTTEEKSEPFQFTRGYEIESEGGESLVSGLSKWLLIDTEARRIVPMKKWTLSKLSIIEKEHDCLVPGKITQPVQNDGKGLELFAERMIQYSDVDANGHTNNSRYLAFAVDSLPKDYREKDFRDIRINYAKEAMIGEMLSIFGSVNEAEKKIFLIGKMGNETSFEVELFW